jgi:hypothetical protein
MLDAGSLMFANVRYIMLAAVLVGAVFNHAQAMDRWTALSMIESANRDNAVGRVGEITRYQIRPELWPGGNPLDARGALVVAQRIMTKRIANFQQAHGRAPTDFEFYILWNAPGQINHPHHAVVERANRFLNLIEETDHAPAPATIPATTTATTVAVATHPAG